MNSKEKAVIEAAKKWLLATCDDMKDTSDNLIVAVKELLEKPEVVVEKGIRHPEKSLEQQLRCIETYGYPLKEYIQTKGCMIHKSVK